MKLLNRAILLSLFAIVTMGWTTHEGLAAENEPLLSIPPTIITIADPANKIGNGSNDYELFSTEYVKSGYSSIELLTGSTLKVSGNTNAYISVNTLRIELYLQQWNPLKGQWVNILAIGSSTEYKTNSISYSKQIKVVSGYSYRIKAQHDIIHNGITEQLTSVSNQVYVN